MLPVKIVTKYENGALVGRVLVESGPDIFFYNFKHVFLWIFWPIWKKYFFSMRSIHSRSVGSPEILKITPPKWPKIIEKKWFFQLYTIRRTPRCFCTLIIDGTHEFYIVLRSKLAPNTKIDEKIRFWGCANPLPHPLISLQNSPKIPKIKILKLKMHFQVFGWFCVMKVVVTVVPINL